MTDVPKNPHITILREGATLDQIRAAAGIPAPPPIARPVTVQAPPPRPPR